MLLHNIVDYTCELSIKYAILKSKKGSNFCYGVKRLVRYKVGEYIYFYISTEIRIKDSPEVYT